MTNRRADCDICGKECDILHEDDIIKILYAKEDAQPENVDDIQVLSLWDVCWDCRREIVGHINEMTQKAKRD